MQVKLTDSAIEDLSEIGRYYFKVGGVTLASSVVAQIKKDVMSLTNYTAPRYELVPGIRRLVVAKGAFLVFHRVTDTVIEVIHVRRSERLPATESDLV
jgi:plasmid stabilization system protein ParE